MTVKVENEYLIATIAEEGAELISLYSKKDQLEYLWQGDTNYWGRRSPVLFPIVGRLKNDTYTFHGKNYSMSQHGFARDSLFDVIEQGKEIASFSLKSSKESKEIYPFDFELILSYELKENSLIVRYQVENTGNEEMFFSVGGHPAFNVPLNKNLSFEDYYLSFSPQKSRTQIPLSGPYTDFANKTLAQTNISIDLRYDLFKNDALIYQTPGTNAFTIETDEDECSITLSYDNMPYVGIWSPYGKEAPFVCIEPWCGIADEINTSGELTEKMGINKLDASKRFNTEFMLTVN